MRACDPHRGGEQPDDRAPSLFGEVWGFGPQESAREGSAFESVEREDDQREFPDDEEEDDGEEEVTGNEESHRGEEGIDRDGGAAHRPPGEVGEDRVEVEDLFDGNAWKVRVEVGEPVEHVDGKHDAECHPHRLAFPERPAPRVLHHRDGELDDRVAKPLLAQPRVAHEAVDTQERDGDHSVQKRPHRDLRRPDVETGEEVEAVVPACEVVGKLAGVVEVHALGESLEELLLVQGLQVRVSGERVDVLHVEERPFAADGRCNGDDREHDDHVRRGEGEPWRDPMKNCVGGNQDD